MKQTWIIIAVAVLLVVVSGVGIVMKKRTTPTPSDTPTTQMPENAGITEMVVEKTQAPSKTEQIDKSKTHTLDEVAMHATASDCWIVVDGKVYDMSPFVEKHPGGKAILQGCGKDASELFASKHGAKQRALLPNFEIGKLTE